MGKAGEVYDRTAITYDLRSGNPYTERVRVREARVIARYARGRVLDAGCGTGYHLRALRDVIGLDVSEEMVSLAKKTGKPVRKGSVERLPFKRGEFETILCMYSVLNLVDWRKAVGELCRVARDSGRVIVSVGSLYDKGYGSVSERKGVKPDRYTQVKKFHIEGKRLRMRLFTKEELVKEFRKHGFVLEEMDSVFRGVVPHWGLWKRIGLMERLKTWMDRFRPVEYGAFYIMVFKGAKG